MKLPDSLLIQPTSKMDSEELEALQIHYCHIASQVEPNRREPLIKLAQIYERRKEWVPANFYATAALELPWYPFYGANMRFYTNEPHEILYRAKGWLGDIIGAQKHIRKCLEYQPYDPQYLHDIKYYFGEPKVSICIPTLGRPEKLKRLLETIPKTTGYANYEVIVEHDKPIPDNEGCPKVLKRCVERSTGEFILFLGNDCVPEQNFVQEAIWEMTRKFPDLVGMVGLNDGYWKGDEGHVATHWMISKKMLPLLDGEFFHTGYFHTGPDNELQARCEKLGKYSWAKNAKIFHDHPINSNWTIGMDEIYEMAYTGPRREADQKLYAERSKKYGFEKRF